MLASSLLTTVILLQAPSAPDPTAPRAQVMILGVYHFDSPNLDYVKSPKVDHLSEAKQEEIAEVLDRLARFAPTKIVLEATPESVQVQAAYAKFRAGEREAAADEREQLGFRLAQQFDHPRVYLADHPSNMDLGAVLTAAEEAKDERFLAWFKGAMGEAQGLIERQSRLPVREVLVALNEPAFLDRTRDLYLQLARVRGPERYVGAEVSAEWYRRNFCIFANIAKIVESPRDHVLVIFGQGHAPYLRECVKSSPDLELVEPNAYLGP